uniref:Plastid lipid-associated protein/fibrillin conserved domain-containing protein n=1 Tax=Opuntia streptacantha TaxID=393608 RepID=A0A7C8ZUY4_OPUST
MASVMAPCSCAPATKKVSHWTNLPTPPLVATINHELETKKYELLTIIQDMERGLKTTADQRSSIEEAMVIVEGYEAGEPIDLEKLDGTWRLQYTSAPDVLVLFEAANRLPFLQLSIGMMLGGADFPEI